MEFLLILQGFGISLGVGASTLAVTNFFVAIWDGHIDKHERRMMGVTYIVLRVAMGLILFSTLLLAILQYTQLGFVDPFILQTTAIIVILFVNAGLMTMHLMPMTFGPSIQASAWYLLGFLSIFRVVDWNLNYTVFILTYLAIVGIATTAINILLSYCKRCQEESGVCHADNN